MEMRPPSRTCRVLTKPRPSAPRRFASGHLAVAEDDFGGIAGAHAELVFFFAGAESGIPFFDDEGGDAFCAFGLVGDGHGHADVGVVAVGGEGFRAVQDPVAVFAGGDRARASGVGARAGFGQGPAAEFFSLRERDDVFFALVFAAEFINVIGAERIVGRDDQADGAVDAGEFLDHRGVFDVAEAARRRIPRERSRQAGPFRRASELIQRENARLRPIP